MNPFTLDADTARHAQIDEAVATWPAYLSEKIPGRDQCPRIDEREAQVAKLLPVAMQAAQIAQGREQAAVAQADKATKFQADWAAINAYTEAYENRKHGEAPPTRPALHNTGLELHLNAVEQKHQPRTFNTDSGAYLKGL